MVKSWPNEEGSTYTAVSAHLSNTSAKRRRCKATFGPAQESRRENYAGGFNTSAYRERGKSKMSSIEETLEETLLILPPDVVPMWGQMEDTVDCRGFVLRTRNVPNWPVARHGSLQTEDEEAEEGS